LEPMEGFEPPTS